LNKAVDLAVKIVEAVDDDKGAVMREIQILKKCRHPNIVSYYGCSLKDRWLWILMEYCENGSVRGILDRYKKFGRKMTELQIAAILSQAAVGLKFLHSSINVIHRDVKCANILINEEGYVKIADFGICFQKTVTRSRGQTAIGTPLYMAPEILDGYGQTVVADVWSLGITTIEMADGVPPYSDEHPMRAMFRLVQEESPTFKNPKEWSDELNSFVDECLRKDPENRAASDILLLHPFLAKMTVDESKQIVKDLIAGLDKKKLAKAELPTEDDMKLPWEIHNPFNFPDTLSTTTDFQFPDTLSDDTTEFSCNPTKNSHLPSKLPAGIALHLPSTAPPQSPRETLSDSMELLLSGFEDLMQRPTVEIKKVPGNKTKKAEPALCSRDAFLGAPSSTSFDSFSGLTQQSPIKTTRRRLVKSQDCAVRHEDTNQLQLISLFTKRRKVLESLMNNPASDVNALKSEIKGIVAGAQETVKTLSPTERKQYLEICKALTRLCLTYIKGRSKLTQTSILETYDELCKLYTETEPNPTNNQNDEPEQTNQQHTDNTQQPCIYITDEDPHNHHNEAEELERELSRSLTKLKEKTTRRRHSSGNPEPNSNNNNFKNNPFLVRDTNHNDHNNHNNNDTNSQKRNNTYPRYNNNSVQNMFRNNTNTNNNKNSVQNTFVNNEHTRTENTNTFGNNTNNNNSVQNTVRNNTVIVNKSISIKYLNNMAVEVGNFAFAKFVQEKLTSKINEIAVMCKGDYDNFDCSHFQKVAREFGNEVQEGSRILTTIEAKRSLVFATKSMIGSTLKVIGLVRSRENGEDVTEGLNASAQELTQDVRSMAVLLRNYLDLYKHTNSHS